MMTPRWTFGVVVYSQNQKGPVRNKSNLLLRHTDAMDFAASNERFGQWVGTEDAAKYRQKR
jgi:hypothetical protein